MSYLTSAKLARQKSNATVDQLWITEKEYIAIRIDKAIDKGEFEVKIEGHIRNQIKAQLVELGYTVTLTNPQFEKSETCISW